MEYGYIVTRKPYNLPQMIYVPLDKTAKKYTKKRAVGVSVPIMLQITENLTQDSLNDRED